MSRGKRAQSTCIFAAVSEIPYTYSMETSFGNRHFCLCVSNTSKYQNFETTGINPPSYPIIMPQIKKFLPAVTEIWVWTDTSHRISYIFSFQILILSKPSFHHILLQLQINLEDLEHLDKKHTLLFCLYYKALLILLVIE